MRTLIHQHLLLYHLQFETQHKVHDNFTTLSHYPIYTLISDRHPHYMPSNKRKTLDYCFYFLFIFLILNQTLHIKDHPQMAPQSPQSMNFRPRNSQQ